MLSAGHQQLSVDDVNAREAPCLLTDSRKKC